MLHTRLLLVEDNPADVTLFQCALAKVTDWPVRVTILSDGDQAVAYLERSGAYRKAPRPDLVILDMNLPKRTGAEVLEWIRGRGELSRIVVILVSSHPRGAIVEQAREQGVQADDYFTKPEDFDEQVALLLAIRRCYEDASRRLLKMPPRSERRFSTKGKTAHR